MKRLYSIIIASVAILAIHLYAAPLLMNYQGILADSAGEPVADGDYTVIFKLYIQPTGGSPFWNETQTLTTHNGLFNTLLGSINPISNFPTTDGVYLAVQLQGEDEMTPRQRIVSVGYAFNAKKAENAQNAQQWAGHNYQYPPISWYEYREGAQNLNLNEYALLFQVNITLPTQMNVVVEAFGPTYGSSTLSDRTRMIIEFYDQESQLISQGAEGISGYHSPCHTYAVKNLSAGNYIVALWAFRTGNEFDLYDVTFSITAYESDNTFGKALTETGILPPPKPKHEINIEKPNTETETTVYPMKKQIR